MIRLIHVLLILVTYFGVVSPAAAESSKEHLRKQKQRVDKHRKRNRFECSNEIRPYRFATLNLLQGEIMLLHVDGYAPVHGTASESCQVKVSWMSEEVVLAEGIFTISPNRTFDNAFPGPDTGVVEVHPVITPIEECNLDIVPILQVQEQVEAGTGKTLYIYPGQFSVPLRDYGDAPCDDPQSY